MTLGDGSHGSPNLLQVEYRQSENNRSFSVKCHFKGRGSRPTIEIIFEVETKAVLHAARSEITFLKYYSLTKILCAGSN